MINEERKTDHFEFNDDFFEQYLKPKRFNPKFWVWVFMAISTIILGYYYKVNVIDKMINPKELLASTQLVQVDSRWVVGEKVDTPDFKGIILVPQISFKVRNVGKKNLEYVYFLGIFRLVDQAKTLGEGFVMAFKKPLKPGALSDERIVLTSKFGYRASSKIAFVKYSKGWRRAIVEVFAKAGTSRLSLLKSFYVSQRIEGIPLDIKIMENMTDQAGK